MPALEFRSNGQEWRGTFEYIIRAALDDILSDGKPLEGVSFEFIDGRSHENATIIRLDSMGAHFATGEVADFDNIKTMTIA